MHSSNMRNARCAWPAARAAVPRAQRPIATWSLEYSTSTCARFSCVRALDPGFWCVFPPLLGGGMFSSSALPVPDADLLVFVLLFLVSLQIEHVHEASWALGN